MLQVIVDSAPQFLLVVARCLGLVFTTPLLSTNAVPRVAKIALAGAIAYIVLPSAYSNGMQFEVYSLEFVFLLLGETMIGVITGFFVSMIFAAFSSAGQLFSLQMGFSAAESYDALSQVENPLMGQYFNLIAMLLFLQVNGFRNLFWSGIFNSFQAFNAYVLVEHRDYFINFLLGGLTDLFFDAMMISLPMVASLFVVQASMGILSKAAPQMNLLSEGLPITILITFFLLTLLMPTMANYFVSSFDIAFLKLENLYSLLKARFL